MVALRPKRALWKTMLLLCLMVSLVIGPAVLIPDTTIPILAQDPSSASTIQNQTGNNESSDPNVRYINIIKSMGIMAGFPDGSFHANEGLTRAQAAVVICKAAGLDPIIINKNRFEDVSKNHWAAGYIAAAVEAGYLSGFPDDTFRPEQQLNRAQGISLILRLSKQSDPGVMLPDLADMTSKHWAARSMAIALDAGMIQLMTPETIKPDSPLSRGDLCRALALLLVNDPDLGGRKLYGTLTVSKGEVQFDGGNQTDRAITTSKQVGNGDTVKTGKDGEALIKYPDGSSLLLKSNSTLIIKESLGRVYIKKNGQIGTAVDNLEVELKAGKMFGGLSSLDFPKVEEAKAGDAVVPWYRSAQQKKVKIKILMPWGVTSIKGSFWQSQVNSNGSGSSNLLEGSAQVTAGGTTVTLAQGEASGVSNSGGPPSAPTPMTAQQASEWTQISAWVHETASLMTANQGAAPPEFFPGSANNQNPADALNQALQSALAQAGASNHNSATNSNSGGDGGDGGGDGSRSCSLNGVKSVYYLSKSYPGTTGAQMPGNLCLSLTVAPGTAAVNCSESGDDVVDVSITSAGSTRSVSLVCKEDSPGVFRSGKETLTFTATAPGRSSATKTVEIYALPSVQANPSSLAFPYNPPQYITLAPLILPMGTNSNNMSIQFIDAETNTVAVNTSGSPVITSNINLTTMELYFQLDSTLPIGHYSCIVNCNGTPIAIGSLNIIETPLPLTLLGIERADYAGQSRFSALDYAGADHFLFRYSSLPLSTPTAGETLDLSQWFPAEVLNSSFSAPSGSRVMAAAVDSSNRVLACSWTMLDPSMIGQLPSESFSTPPVFVPGIWVSSTTLSEINDTNCGSFKWMSSPSSFSSVTPAYGADCNSQVFDVYADCLSGNFLTGMTNGAHIGIMGINTSGYVEKFIDHTVAADEISSATKAPDLAVTFFAGTGDPAGTTQISGAPVGTTLKIIIDNNSPQYDAAVGADASSTGVAYSLGTPIQAAAEQHVWVFALDNSNKLVAFTDHIVKTEELAQ